MSEKCGRAAVEAFVAAIGPDAVLTAADDLQDFRDPYTFSGWDAHAASAVVMPSSVEQVRDVLRIANEFRVSLWTFSQGRNYGYGGPAPRVSGSVLLSLQRMSRVLEIDDECAYAVVEPGVRFFDLYDAIRAGGHRLWPSIPDLGWGSVIGNTLDHGVGFTPLGDHPRRQCGMEVVLPNGDVLRTGMGAMANSKAWHMTQRGFGPSPDGLFMQSNLGVVTKMGVWLTPEPDCYMPCTVHVDGEDDLEALIETIRPLLLDGTIPNYPVVYNALRVARAFAGVGRDYWYDGDGPIPDEVLQRMATETGSGWWYMRFALYGREEIVDTQYSICERAFSHIPGARVRGRKLRGDTVAETCTAATERLSSGPQDAVASMDAQCAAIQAGVPGLALLQNASWEERGHAGHVDYSPVAPLTGRAAQAQVGFLRAIFERHGFDLACALMLGPRSFTTINTLWFDIRDAQQVRATYDFLRVLIEEGARVGYAPYRAHLDVMDLVADQYAWGDHAQRRFNETLKDALDPNGILSPGKQGIWPWVMRPAPSC